MSAPSDPPSPESHKEPKEEETPHAASPLGRAKRVALKMLKITLGTIVGLYVFYLVAVNVLLNWSGFHHWLSAKQGIIDVEIESGYSWRPFSVHVEGLRMWVREGPVEVFFDVEMVEADYDPFPMKDRIISFTRVEGHGFDFRLRRRYPEGKLPAEAPSGLAVFPNWGPLPAPVKGEMGDDDLSNNWNVDMQGIDVNLSSVWVERARYQGDLRVQGGFILFTERTIELPTIDLDFAPGQLDVAGSTVSEAFSSNIWAHMPTWSIAEPDIPKLLKGLEVEMALVLPVKSTEGITSMAELEENTISGSGLVMLDVGLADAKLRDGSFVTAQLSEVVARVDETRVQADQLLVAATHKEGRTRGSVRAIGEGKHGVWPLVRLTKLNADGGIDIPSLLEAPNGPKVDAHVHVAVPALDLGKAQGLDDMTVKGQGGAALHFKLERNGDAHANLGVQAEIDARQSGVRFDGDIKARILARGDLRHQHLANLEGDVEAKAKHAGALPGKPWGLDVELGDGKAEPGRARLTVGLRMTDVEPLLDLHPIDKKVPDLATALLDLSNVEVTSQVVYDEGQTTLKIVHAQTDSLDCQGFVRMKGGQTQAAVLIEVAGTSWGISFDGGGLSITPLAGDDWAKEHFAVVRTDG